MAIDAACAHVRNGTRYSFGGGHGRTPGASFGWYDGYDPASANDHRVKGFDCSGLMRWAWYSATGEDFLAGTAERQRHTARAMARFPAAAGLAPLLPGDLLFWGWGEAGHNGMYLGAGKVVHTNQSGTPANVVTVDGSGRYGSAPYLGAVRIAGTVHSDPGYEQALERARQHTVAAEQQYGSLGCGEGCTAGGIAPANAMTWGTDVAVRAEPATDSAVLLRLRGPTPVHVSCQRRGQLATADGYTNDVWSYLPDYQGWMTNIYVVGDAWLAGVPECP